MNGFWTGAGAAQQVIIAAASVWNAAYFTRRARSGSWARRLAAGLLALLFLGVGLEALAGVPVSASMAEVLWRMPLLLATTAIAWFVANRPHDRVGSVGDRRNGGAR